MSCPYLPLVPWIGIMGRNKNGGLMLLSHTVFFTLKEPTEQNIDRLVAECNKWLKGAEGLVYYGAGKRAAEYARPVNDTEFHVVLNTVFDSKAAHDAYQPSDNHKAFVEANKETWAKVRVFDAEI